MADIATRSARPEKRRHGLVVVFTGDGKGKTTAAMGLALRAHGNRMRVRIIQFIKGTWKTGEVESLRALAPGIEVVRAGRGFTIERLRDPRIPMDEHALAAKAGLAEARESLLSGQLDVLVLDEIFGAVNAELITAADILELLDARPAETHLVLTGRRAPAEVVERADLVTEMRLVKHPYTQGIKAQRGIEF